MHVCLAKLQQKQPEIIARLDSILLSVPQYVPTCPWKINWHCQISQTTDILQPPLPTYLMAETNFAHQEK